MTIGFTGLAALVSFAAGAVASVVGFGIGSLLTTVVAVRFGTDFAIAMVALPHLAGGLLLPYLKR
jgi:hypothetical protein